MSIARWTAPHHVIIIVDGPDPDNYICALAASSRKLDLPIAAVIMTGRPVSAAQNAKPYEFNAAASKAVRRDNALHMRGVLLRHGREHIPVFEGLRAPYSTIPHSMHIHERVTDVLDDAHAGHDLAGNFDDAVAYLGNLPGTLHFICGGPLTDLAQLLKEPMVNHKLGIVTAQLGMFGTNNVQALAGGRRQFNALADPVATRNVLYEYPGPVYLIPSDITKHSDHAFEDPADMATLANSPEFAELVEMYKQAWPIMWGPRGEKLFVHDFHPAELMGEIRALNYQLPEIHQGHTLGRYGFSPITVEHVPYAATEMNRWGEIDITIKHSPAALPRLLSTTIDTSVHRGIVASVLNAGAVLPLLPQQGRPDQVRVRTHG